MAKSKTLVVGDRVKLPSGTSVLITASHEDARPWQAIESGDAWHVCRFYQHAGQRGASFYFGGQRKPMQLDEADAKALAAALNRAKPA
jgi:hypothetical protein